MGKTLRNIAMALGLVPAALGINCNNDLDVRLIKKPDAGMQADASMQSDAGNEPCIDAQVENDASVVTGPEYLFDVEACIDVCTEERVIYSPDYGGDVIVNDCDYSEINLEGEISSQNLDSTGDCSTKIRVTEVLNDNQGNPEGVSFEAQTYAGEITGDAENYDLRLGENITLATVVNSGGTSCELPEGDYYVQLDDLTSQAYTKTIDSNEVVTVEHDMETTCATVGVYKAGNSQQ